MPLALPIIAEIATIAAGAGTLAYTGYELANQPGSGSTTAPTGQTQAQAQQLAQLQAQQNAQQKAAFLAAQPNVQASTGGGLTGTALNTATATAAGVPSDLNSLAKYLGLSTGNQPTNANVSGGITVTPGAQQAQAQQSYDLQSLTDLLRA